MDEPKQQAMMVAPSAEFRAKYAAPVSDLSTEACISVLRDKRTDADEPPVLTDAQIANMGRLAGYTLYEWAERLNAYVKQARRHGLVK